MKRTADAKRLKALHDLDQEGPASDEEANGRGASASARPISNAKVGWMMADCCGVLGRMPREGDETSAAARSTQEVQG